MCSLELLSLARSSNTTRKSSERNDPFVLFNVAEICISFRQFHAYKEDEILSFRVILMHGTSHTRKSSSHFAHVLEMRSEILATGERCCDIFRLVLQVMNNQVIRHLTFFGVVGKCSSGVTNCMSNDMRTCFIRYMRTTTYPS